VDAVKEFIGNDRGRSKTFSENSDVWDEIGTRHGLNANCTCYHLANLLFLLFLYVYDEGIDFLDRTQCLCFS
jgi:hypothetical protein